MNPNVRVRAGALSAAGKAPGQAAAPVARPRHVSDPGTSWTVTDPADLATAIRLRALQMVAPHGFGYLGQALSSAEQVAAMFSVARPGLDRMVCSPSHYVVAFFAAAGELGLLAEEELAGYGFDDASLEAIGTERSPVLDFTCGSLGQGLSAAIGFAWSDRYRGRDARTFVLVSDGELEEGQVWEGALFAGHNRLASLTVLIDANNSQVDGPVDSITTLEPIAAKWEAFGWHAVDLPGHDVHSLIEALRREPDPAGRPSVIVARTSTVHGIESLPPDSDGHFIKLSADVTAAASAELIERRATRA